MSLSGKIMMASRERARLQRVDNRSTSMLETVISKKLTTTMIGAISEFEKAFGIFWGHGKNESDKTDNEKKNSIVWQAVRNNILNLGNNNKRALQNELNEYSINRKKYTYKFLPRR